MAEIGLAASIVGIASTGVAVVSALTKFGISFRGSDEKINTLASRVSLAASILSNVASIVEENESGFKNAEFLKTWGKVLTNCEKSYEKLNLSLSKTKRSGSNKRGSGQDDVSVWGRLVWALGGDAEMRDLEASLERSCQQVMMMQQAVQMSVLSLVAQRQRESAQGFGEHREQLQWLLTGLSQLGLLNGPKHEGMAPSFVINEPQQDFRSESDNRSLPQVPLPLVQSMFAIPSMASVPPRTGALSTTSTPSMVRDWDSTESATAQTSSRQFSQQALSLPDLASDSMEDNSMIPEPVTYPPSEPVFEAFYVLPRALSRAQERGRLQFVKPTLDDYMIVCVDIRNDLRKDHNLRHALQQAKRSNWEFKAFQSASANFDKALIWLLKNTEKYAQSFTWNIGAAIDVPYARDSLFKLSTNETAFLVVLRGTPTNSHLFSPKSKSSEHGVKRGRPLKSDYLIQQMPVAAPYVSESASQSVPQSASRPSYLDSVSYTQRHSSPDPNGRYRQIVAHQRLEARAHEKANMQEQKQSAHSTPRVNTDISPLNQSFEAVPWEEVEDAQPEEQRHELCATMPQRREAIRRKGKAITRSLSAPRRVHVSQEQAEDILMRFLATFAALE